MNFRNGGSTGEKKVHAPGYDGPDRRVVRPPQRASDVIAGNLKLFALMLGVAMSIFAMGGGWISAKLAIDSKVDKAEWNAKNAQQDLDRAEMTRRIERTETINSNVDVRMGRMETRLRDIYCEGKPPGCQ